MICTHDGATLPIIPVVHVKPNVTPSKAWLGSVSTNTDINYTHNNSVHTELVKSTCKTSARALRATQRGKNKIRAPDKTKNTNVQKATTWINDKIHVLQVQQGADTRRDRTTQLIAVQPKDPVRKNANAQTNNNMYVYTDDAIRKKVQNNAAYIKQQWKTEKQKQEALDYQ